MKTKTCTKCGQEKPLDKFYYGRAECKACATIRRRGDKLRQKDKPAPAPADLPPGVVTLKDAAEIIRELTGFKCSANELRHRADTFRQIAKWSVRNDGGDRFEGINRARLVGFIKHRPGATSFAELFGEGL